MTTFISKTNKIKARHKQDKQDKINRKTSYKSKTRQKNLKIVDIKRSIKKWLSTLIMKLNIQK